MHRTQGDNYAVNSNGNRVFKESVPPTTVTSGWLTSVQEEIANAIEDSGQELAVDSLTDLNNQLSTAIQRSAAYDAIITSQETFNDLWERVSANVYKIKDGIGSVYFKTPAGGFYNLSSTSSPLSDGDTWGEYQTNEASFIMCDGSCYMQLGDTPSYININSSNTIVYNLDARGVGATASGITKTIYIDATALNCKLLFVSASERISNLTHNVIYDCSNTALLFGGTVSSCNNTANEFRGISDFGSIVGSTVRDMTLTTTSNSYSFYSFFGVGNITGCNVLSIETTGFCVGFFQLDNLSSCVVSDIVSLDKAYGFYSCQNLTGCETKDIVSVDNASGFFGCQSISACRSSNITVSVGVAFGFSVIDTITGCRAYNITAQNNGSYGFSLCDNVSGSKALLIIYSGTSSSYKAHGYSSCDRISGCEAKTIQATGANGYAYGFSACNNLAATIADTITAVTSSRTYGYHTCGNVSSSCSATAVDDIDFYAVSTTPFRGDSNTVTPFGFTDVWNKQSLATGATLSYTPAKDCILFGNIGYSGGTSVVYGNVGSAVLLTPADIVASIQAASFFSNFSIPVKAGDTIYFKTSTNTVLVTMRYMPFGTTT